MQKDYGFKCHFLSLFYVQSLTSTTPALAIKPRLKYLLKSLSHFVVQNASHYHKYRKKTFHQSPILFSSINIPSTHFTFESSRIPFVISRLHLEWKHLFVDEKLRRKGMRRRRRRQMMMFFRFGDFFLNVLLLSLLLLSISSKVKTSKSSRENENKKKNRNLKCTKNCVH